MSTKDIISIIRKEVSAKRLMQSVKEVSCYHRVQASQGYRDAAMHCREYLRSLGIQADILSYDANGKDFVGPYKLFQEWNIEKAYCDVLYPIEKRIADFSLEPISVIQKSYPCDVEAEVVLMDKGSDPKGYDDIDFHGKIIFIHEHFKEYAWVVQERGAIGYISDFYQEVPFIRNREEMQDSLSYTSFWWKHTEEEVKAFGFVLSPRDGKELSLLCEQVRKDYADHRCESPYIRVHAVVRSKLFDGHYDVVEATLPGKSEDTILIIAHLCHPCASANDNASGVSGGMEILRSLHTLIEKGKLAPLQQTVKLILVPEFTGTYGYLSDHDIRKLKAGINLDMIGGRQTEGYGPITVTHLPHALPSFVDHVASMIMKQVQMEDQSVEDMKMSMIRTSDHLFQLGSDHSVLCDPMVDIPCIMLGQWPDKNYHTSTDTLDKIDPIVLKLSAVTAAAYAYALANHAIVKEQLLLEMRMQYVQEMNHIADGYVKQDRKNAFTRLCTYYRESLKSFYDYEQLPAEPTELDHFSVLCSMYPFEEHPVSYPSAYEQVPVRMFCFPISDLEDHMLHDNEMQTAYRQFHKEHPIMAEDHCTMQALCDYYVDGKRTIAEIYECVKAETGHGMPEDILAYITIMQKLKLMR